MTHDLELADDPFVTFDRWFTAAMKSGLRNADGMALATATPAGKPSARMVLLRGYDPRGFVFYTNYESRKSEELELNPQAALLFYWEKLDRQIRIEGTVAKISGEESDRYFQSRPYESRLSAAASPQSRIVESRTVLEDRVRELDAQFRTREVPRPEFWGGYRLNADRFEFWIADPHRLHDRFEYVRGANGEWLRRRLAP